MQNDGHAVVRLDKSCAKSFVFFAQKEDCFRRSVYSIMIKLQ